VFRSAIHNPKSAIDGITLVELAIVLTGACILLAAAVPSLDRLHREWTLWGAARLLERSLQWGRMHAVTTNSSLVFEIDPEGRHFYWADPGNGEEYVSTVRYFPGRVRIVGSPGRSLRFFPRGNAAPAGTFVLQGEAGFYRVVVNPAGRIRVERN
jgi:Type II transport protein GspH